jgi:microcystin-dependent protein
MSEPFLAEIRLVSFNFPPKGWALCNGQLLPINQNQALFSVLGTTYGGDGRTTFALPNLQGRVPLQTGGGFALGQSGGEAAHVLTVGEIPAHSHTAAAASEAGSAQSPQGNFWAAVGPFEAFSDAPPDTTLNPGAIATTGANQAHDNMPPFLVLNFVIALQGIFPSRN